MPGPAPSSTRQQVGLGARPLKVLPSTGREGPPPKWPLGGRAPARWRVLWSLPQAVAWEEDHHELVVARYCRVVRRAEEEDAPASIMGEARQLEDRLGLTPMSLLRLRWSIASAAPGAVDDDDDSPADHPDPDLDDDLEVDHGAEVTRLDHHRRLYA